MRTWALSRRSDLAGQLLRLDDRVGARDGITAGALEVEAAAVLLRVPMAAAERVPASAHEAREPHLIAAPRTGLAAPSSSPPPRARGAATRRRLPLRRP